MADDTCPYFESIVFGPDGTVLQGRPLEFDSIVAWSPGDGLVISARYKGHAGDAVLLEFDVLLSDGDYGIAGLCLPASAKFSWEVRR